MPERSRPRRRWLTAILLLLSAVVSVPVFIALYQAFDLFGLPGALGVLIGVSAVLIVAWLVHAVRVFGGPVLMVARSIAGSIGVGLREDPYLSRAGARLARPIGFLRRRLDPGDPGGLFLTVSVAATVVMLSAFWSVTSQVRSGGVLPQADVRLANLSDVLHHGAPLHVATFFTLIGGATFRIPFTLALFAVVWLKRPTLRPLVGLLMVLVLAPALSDLGRQLVRRPRPPVGASALPGSFSYPSGHAAGAAGAFGYAAFLAVRAVRRLRAQMLISLAAMLLMLGVGYSRVVLGFHWASDVAGGIVLGLAVLGGVAAWVGSERGTARVWRVPGATGIRLGAVALAVAIAAWAGVDAAARPLHAPTLRPPPVQVLPAGTITDATLQSFPLHSETLTGRQMEPVGLILVGTREQIEAAFGAAGWSRADPVNLHSLLRVYSAGLHNRPYPTAPVTPAFLAGRPQDLAFEKAVVAGSVRKRHHTRIWSSGFALADGSPIWLATASLDDRVEIKLTTLLPNHHIAPDIDTERDLIARELLGTGLVSSESLVQAVPPELGTNAAGDPFFTYGKAVVIVLRSSPAGG